MFAKAWLCFKWHTVRKKKSFLQRANVSAGKASIPELVSDYTVNLMKLQPHRLERLKEFKELFQPASECIRSSFGAHLARPQFSLEMSLVHGESTVPEVPSCQVRGTCPIRHPTC